LANLFHPVHLGEDGDNGLVQEKQEVTSSTAATASSSTTTASSTTTTTISVAGWKVAF